MRVCGILRPPLKIGAAAGGVLQFAPVGFLPRIRGIVGIGWWRGAGQRCGTMKPHSLLGLAFITVSAQAQILVNGSFESPSLTFTQDFGGAFSFSGWSGVAPTNGGSAGIVVGAASGLTPAAGGQHFNLNGGNPSDRGYLEQSFATIPGASYQVDFSVGRAGGGQALSVDAVVSYLSVPLAAGSFSPPASVGYAPRSLAFTAGGGSATLRFTDASGGNSISDLYLDGVSVSLVAVPEPAAWAAGAGAVALGVAWRRRRG